jgi:hypothetical protein
MNAKIMQAKLIKKIIVLKHLYFELLLQRYKNIGFSTEEKLKKRSWHFHGASQESIPVLSDISLVVFAHVRI